MGKIGEAVAGAALVAGAVALDVATGGAALGLTAAEFSLLVTTTASLGASLALAGVGGLIAGTPTGGSKTSKQNPIEPWNICYGQVKVGGTFLYIESNGGILSNGSNTYDKCTNFVIGLAAHPIQSVDVLRLNGKPVELGVGGNGAQNTEWTYTPVSNQNQVGIASISRSAGVVTMVLSAPLTGQNGLQLFVHNVYDATFNGTFTVTQPNPTDATTFTYLCGGANTTSSGGSVYTTYPDYKNRIHIDRTSCLGNHTSTFPELMSTSTLWTAAHKNLGKASVYLAYYYDANVFSNGLPQSSFVISGKNDIYDPRSGTYGYTTNAALIIADFLTNKTWGYGLNYGTDIPIAQLIAAANICDQQIPLAAGGYEAQYTINMEFNLSRMRGEILQDMLNACAGRITYQSGQFVIVPGAWVGPSLSLSETDLIGPIEFKPYLTIRDACNGVKGTYISPVNNWQQGDIPPYAEDALHGYASDRWLAADLGQRLWKDVSFPATTSCSTAQRLAKIELERIRREGRLTLHCGCTAYSAVALDVIEFTYARYGWVNKTFEVLSSRLVVHSNNNGGAPYLGVDLELAETDSTVYNWSTAEQLTPTDGPSPAIDNGQIVTPPQNLTIQSGNTTAYTGNDGIVLPRILATWTASPDAHVQSGGHYQVEYQKVGDSLWTPVGNVDGTQTQCYIQTVLSGSQYNVQLQAYRSNGVGSGWIQAGPITVSANQTSIASSNVTYPDGTPVSSLQPVSVGSYGEGSQIWENCDFLQGSIQGFSAYQNASISVISAGANPVNTTAKYLQVSSTGTISTTTGAGFVAGPIVQNVSGAFQSGTFLSSHTYYVRIYANLPVGFTFAAPTNGSVTTYPVTPMMGLGVWSPYIWKMTISETPVTGTDFGFITAYGTAASVVYQVALVSIVDLTVNGGMGVRFTDNSNYPIIDLHSNHINKTLDYIGDGTSNYSVKKYALNTTGGTPEWINLGTWYGQNIGAHLNVSIHAGNYGGYASSVVQAYCSLENNGAGSNVIPNANANYSGTGTALPIGALKMVASGTNTTGAGHQWDIYVAVNTYVAGFFTVTLNPGDTFTYNGAFVSYPGVASSTVVDATGGKLITDASGNLANNVLQYDPNGTAQNQYLVGYHSFDNVRDGSTYIRPSGVNADHTYHISTPFLKQGGIITNASGGIFSASATNTAISAWNVAESIPYPDGTNLNIPANGTSASPAYSFTGLTASTTYYFSVWYDLSTSVIHMIMSDVNGGTSPPSLTQQVQTVNSDGHVALVVGWAVTTAATTTSTGGGTSPPQGCVEEGTEVVQPEGTVEELLPCSEWVNVRFGDEKPLVMHPDTLVAVFKKASELTIDDKIEISVDGYSRWQLAEEISHSYKPGVKVKRTCPGGIYHAGNKKVRLHNLKLY